MSYCFNVTLVLRASIMKLGQNIKKILKKYRCISLQDIDK